MSSAQSIANFSLMSNIARSSLLFICIVWSTRGYRYSDAQRFINVGEGHSSEIQGNPALPLWSLCCLNHSVDPMVHCPSEGTAYIGFSTYRATIYYRGACRWFIYSSTILKV